VKYAFVALDSGAKKVTGFTDCRTAAEAILELKNREFTVLDLRIAEPLEGIEIHSRRKINAGLDSRVRSFLAPKGKVNRQLFLENFVSQMVMFVRGGVQLAKAMRIMVEAESDIEKQALLSDLEKKIRSGVSLSDSFEQSGFGDPFVLGMIRGGELSGDMLGALERIDQHLVRRREMRSKLVSSTIYPAVLAIVSVLSIVLMFGFVLPQFEDIFKEMGEKLPILTIGAMAISSMLRMYFVELIFAFALFTILVPRVFRVSGWGEVFSRLAQRSSLVRYAIVQYNCSVLLSALGSLLKSGLPLPKAFDTSLLSISDSKIRSKLSPISKELREGKAFSRCIADAEIFDSMTIGLIRVGEETGKLHSACDQMAEALSKRFDLQIGRILQLVEPVMILILGVIVGAIIIAILLGILSINEFVV